MGVRVDGEGGLIEDIELGEVWGWMEVSWGFVRGVGVSWGSGGGWRG